MNAIVPFTFGDRPVRIEDRAGELWLAALDVCAALEIDRHRDAVARLDDDERGSVMVDTPGGRQSVAAINESGLYRLVLRSRKPAARRFRKWITAEVLPAIRRTGAYGLPATLDVDDNAQLRRLLLGKLVQIDELAPRAAAFDRIADARGALSLTEAAKALKIGRKALIGWLLTNGWIYRRPASNSLLGFREKELAGFLEHRVVRVPSYGGPDRIRDQVMVTSRGLARLAQLLPARETSDAA